MPRDDMALAELPPRTLVPDSSRGATIEAIRHWHRERVFAMTQRMRVDLALGAFIRTQLGWSLDKPDAERASIAAQAKSLIAVVESEGSNRKRKKALPQIDAGPWRDIIKASIAARKPFEEIEKRAVKEMEALAITLPAWSSWGNGVRGFGPKGLATIIGEAGDLSNYATKERLWKRMGLAVINGVRQGGLPKNAAAELWVEHGYNRARRSRMWNVGVALVRAGGPYADLCRERKKDEAAKAAAEGLTVAPSAKIPKKRAAEFRSLGHIHARAQRYMEKRLLRDLWRAWHKAAHE